MSSTKSVLLVVNNPYANMLSVQQVITKELKKFIKAKHKAICQKMNSNHPLAYLTINSEKSLPFKQKWGVWKAFSINSFDFESFHYVFGVGDTIVRSLFTTITDDKYEAIPDNDGLIVFSMSDFGMSDEIINCVADACKSFGTVYIRFSNDTIEKFNH